MATPGMNPGGGAPGGAPQPQPQGGQGGQGGGANPLQIIAGITRLAQMLAQTAPPCSPEAEATVQQMQKCAQKIMGAQNQQGGGGPATY